ncbi:MAG: polysaccharide pyruvyl transferase family protein [Burkholderiaceae bacterium]|jgi:colanic acid/amylovoran biosynthesis protein|nr:polysaccharide pyruvyl transferase family protein [Burkholderiaceae bacterium]
MRVLLRGGGFVNKGAEAMLLTVKAELTRRIPQARFVLPADCIHSDAEAGDAGGHGFEIQAVPPATPWRLAGAAVRAAARAPRQAGDLWRKRSEAFETLALLDGVDAVVDVHGYAFGDPWPPKYVLRTAAYVTHCRQQGKPYVFMPQSWGPFERETTRAGYRWLCTGSALYYARDDTSRDYLAELLACDAVQIRQSPDIVFLFDPADHGGAAGDPLPPALDAVAGPMVGISPNMRVYERAQGEGADNVYVRTLVRICRHFADQGITVVLLPHEIRARQGDGQRPDDRHLIRLVAGAVGGDAVIPVLGRHTAPQIKSVIARLDLLIGSRFHALVGALSAGVPAVALGWSHKYFELLKDVGLDGLCTDYEEANLASADDMIARAWAERGAFRRRLSSNLEGIRRQVAKTFDEVAATLRAA